jgi:hypothetical protein
MLFATSADVLEYKVGHRARLRYDATSGARSAMVTISNSPVIKHQGAARTRGAVSGSRWARDDFRSCEGHPGKRVRRKTAARRNQVVSATFPKAWLGTLDISGIV